MLSIIIPTLNAAATLPSTLRSLADLGPEVPHEVIVVDGGSIDATRRIAADAGAIVIGAPRGRGPQLAAGAAAAAGDWLLVLHADTTLGPGWAAAVAAFVADPASRRRAAYFRFALDDPAPAARRLETAVLWRNRLFGLPYGDQGLLVARPLYDAVGGYKRLVLMEDVDLVQRIGRRNLVMLEPAATTSAARYRREGYLSRPLRNLVCLGLFTLGIPSRYIHALYR